jgi:hypothetical protein
LLDEKGINNKLSFSILNLLPEEENAEFSDVQTYRVTFRQK